MSHDEEVDITTKIPLRLYSIHYLPFWVLTLSKFLLFLTNNIIVAFTTTLFGRLGAFSMALMYIFFTIGNFLAPLLNNFLGHNMALLMFMVSIIYTLFTFTMTLIVYSEQYRLFDNVLINLIFFLSSSIVGLAGGAIWVGYGVLNIQLGEYVPKRLLADHLANNLLEPQDDQELLLQRLTKVVKNKITSIGWSLLSLNTVIGGILTFIILITGDRNNNIDSTLGNDEIITPDLANEGHLLMLFIVLSLISILANVFYWVLYCYYTNEISLYNFDNHLTLDDNVCNYDNNDSNPGVDRLLIERHQQRSQKYSPSVGPITLSSSPAMFARQSSPDGSSSSSSNSSKDSETTLLLSAKFQQLLDDDEQHKREQQQQQQLTTSYGSTCIEEDKNVNSPSSTQNTNGKNIEEDYEDNFTIDGSYLNSSYSSSELTQWEILTTLIKSPYIIFSIPQYLFSGCGLTYLFALFIPVIVRPVLGLAVTPLIITFAYLSHTIVCYFIGNYINTRMSARNMSIIGNVVQLLPIVLPLIITIGGAQNNENTNNNNSIFDSWAFIIFISLLVGIGDAIHSSSLMTVMTSDLKNDHSLGGLRFAKVSLSVERELNEILYSFYSSIKSFGAFLTFLLSGIMMSTKSDALHSYQILQSCQTQSLILLGLGLLSVLGQLILRKQIIRQMPL